MTDPTFDALIRQYFSTDVLDADPAPMHRVLDMLRRWLRAEHGKPYPDTPWGRLADGYRETRAPAQGLAIDEFLDELDATVLSNTAQLNHPKYIGHMTQALPWTAVMAEAFTAALNQNQVKIETAYASTLIEKQLLGWLHRQVYDGGDAFYAEVLATPGQAVGNFVSGGTMGNLTALAVALECQLPGTRKLGLPAALNAAGYAGLAVVGSQRCHYSIKKALATLGLGEQALHLVPVDRDNRIDLDALEATITRLNEARIKIVALVGIAGTTETGAIDPLEALADIARREQAWFHVDAAWGGALLLSERFAPLCHGIARADSVVIDGHKLFWVPMAQGMVLFRERGSLDRLRHSANYILRENSGDLGQTSLEGSRRFDALKLWTSFKLIGLDGYAALLDQAAALTDRMKALLIDSEDFELTTESAAFILTYRYVPAPLRQQLARLAAAGQTAELATLNERLSALNVALQERQKAAGNSFVSRTVLESAGYGSAITVLRVVLTNVTTTAAHLREILAEQRRIGAAIALEVGI